MNVSKIAENLRKTIAGKEEYLANLEIPIGPAGDRMAKTAIAEFLAINIRELKVILFDVEQCVAKDVEQSWRDNPDRMGGQFTQDEIDNAEKW